jgi:predicted RNA-binding Zn-ribbon protein involved in translation (DUF1610 family)
MPHATFQGYYTPSQAIAKLGVSRTTLEAYIQSGRLERHYPPGRKHGVIPQSQVDDLSRELAAFMAVSAAQREPIHFLKGTIDDMEACAQLVKSIFGVAPSVERRKSWLEKNPDVCYIVKQAERIVGVAFMLPLTREKIEQVFTTERIPPIMAEDLQVYEPGKPVHLYIVSMGVLPSSQTNRRLWGARLISGIMKAIIDLGHRGIVIEDISARSIYPEGIELMKHIGMTEVPSITDQRNFTIKVAESGIPTVLEYRAALARYQGESPPLIPKMQKYPKATLCPNCGDIDVEEYTFLRQGKTHKYVCTKCGHEEER